MKKISLFLACLVAMLSFTACVEDTQPRLDKDPATLSFKVNTPPMANQLIYLTNNDTEGTTIDITCSQPDYGFAAIANYAVMVSLSENFTHNSKELHESGDTPKVDKDGNPVLDKDGNQVYTYFPQEGDYVELRNPGTLARIQVSQLDVTRAICKLLTYTDANGDAKQVESAADLQKAMDEHYPNGYMPVYMKVHCYIPQDVEMSSVVSENCIKFEKIVPSFSLEVPNVIYLVGEYNGWPTPDASAIASEDDPQASGKVWAVSELSTEIDSKVFHASFWLKSTGSNEFRFYQAPLHGWGADGSIGASEADFSKENLVVEDGVAKMSVVMKGQGNFWLTGPDEEAIEEGWYDFTVDLNLQTIEVRKVSEPTYPTNYDPTAAAE